MRLILCLAAALLASCTTVKTDVTRFHSLPATGNGETFHILLPSHVGTLEANTHAAEVAKGFQKYGWRPGGTDSDFKVRFDYSISSGKTTTGMLPLMGQTGGGTTFHSGTFSTYGTGGSAYGTVSGTSYSAPTFGVVGAVPYSQTTYTRQVLLYVTNKRGQSVLEARGRSSGTSGDINYVLPSMIDALFTGFPGISGKTKLYATPLR